MTEFDKYSDLMNLIGYGLATFDMDFVKEFGFKTRPAFYQYCVDLGFAKTINLLRTYRTALTPILTTEERDGINEINESILKYLSTVFLEKKRNSTL